MRSFLKSSKLFERNVSQIGWWQQHIRYEHQTSTVDAEDVKRHSHLAADWWNPNGPMQALHSMNQIRVPFIRDGLIATGRVNKDNVNTAKPLENVRILEVGCGAGLLTEQLARIHANVVGIDPGTDVINAARDHLLKYPKTSIFGQRIDYRNESIEEHIGQNLQASERYDAVVVSEVLEHVNDKENFLFACSDALKMGGSLFITTFNKTNLSWFGGIVMAEDVLQLVPKNVHDWNKFISPLDTQRILGRCGCTTIVINGFVYEFWRNKWRWTATTQLSYALQAIKL